MTVEDCAALAAEGLQRWAVDQLENLWALSMVATHAAGNVARSALASGVPYSSRTLAEAVEVLRQELGR